MAHWNGRAVSMRWLESARDQIAARPSIFARKENETLSTRLRHIPNALSIILIVPTYALRGPLSPPSAAL